MRYRIGNSRKWMLSATLVLAISSTGCQTGWKMPGASLFSWNKKPDPETLAGKGPSVYPTSPATKYTPSTVASATNPSGTPTANSGAPTVGSMPANSSGVSANQYAATMGNRGAFSPGSTPSATAPATAAPVTPNSPYGGVAATANGYRAAGVPAVSGAPNGGSLATAGYATGPYATSATPNTGTNAPGVAPSAVPGSYPGQAVNPATNPYGASNTYAGVTSGMGSTAPGSIPGAPNYGATSNPSAVAGLPSAQVQPVTQSINGAPAAVAGGYNGSTNFPGQLASRATPAGAVAGAPAFNASTPTSSMPMMNPSAAGYSQMPNGLPGATTANGLTGSTSSYRLADTAGASIPSAVPNASLPPTAQYPTAGNPNGLNPAAQFPATQNPTTQNPAMQNPAMQNPGFQYPGMTSPAGAPGSLPGTAQPAAGAVAPGVYTAPAASSYRPGSTRDSSYDFSKGAAGASTGANSLPPMPGIGGAQPPSNFPTNSGSGTSLPTYNGSVVR